MRYKIERVLSCCLFAASTLAVAEASVALETGSAGSGVAFTNEQPTLGVNFFLDSGTNMIRMFAGDFIPGGSVVPTSLENRVVVGAGNGPGLSSWNSGQTRGTSTQTLSVGNLPSHSHTFNDPGSPTTSVGGGNAFSNFQPTTAATYGISLTGINPFEPALISGGEPYIGQVAAFAGDTVPDGWLKAEGQILQASQYPDLYSLLVPNGSDGEGELFALPDLRGRVPVHIGQGEGLSKNWNSGEKYGSELTTLSTSQMPSHTHSLPALGGDTDPSGGDQTIDNIQPSLGINFSIVVAGAYPSFDIESLESGYEPLLGEISMFAFDSAPPGWALADGDSLQVAQNIALFSLLGDSYGGNGSSEFDLPDLRGRTPIHVAGEPGALEGVEFVVLSESNLPAHTHEYVPEPTNAALLGLAGLMVMRRRR